MNILIIGSSGLIGHTLVRELSPFHNVTGTLHRSITSYKNPFFSKYKFIDEIDVTNLKVLERLIVDSHPDFVLNCAGITKRKITGENLSDVIDINSSFPHKLAKLSEIYGFRVIHFSTDCVFDGKKGNYDEIDLTTAEDIYGRTKALGELSTYKKCLTIRSSFIGQELFDKTELLEWFLLQEGKMIRGYRKTLYSGVSTIFMAQVVNDIITKYPGLNGLFHLAPEKPISKYDLLTIAKEKFKLNVDIIPDDDIIHTPTLNASKLANSIKIKVPEWDKMLAELTTNTQDYKQ